MRTTCGVAAIVLSSAAVWAQTRFTDVRIREIEPSVVVQRAGDGESYQAEVNEPLGPGDRIWTSASGRAELIVADETVVWLGPQSEVEISGQNAQAGAGLRLWSGALVAQTRPETGVTIETPQGGVELAAGTRALVELRGGTLSLSTLQGEAHVRTASGSIAIPEGESTTVGRSGAIAPTSAFAPETVEADGLVAWSLARDEHAQGTVSGQEYLPDELQSYGAEIASYGDWRYETEVGYVWYPRVDVSWRPYYYGRWTHTRFGWTWVPRERWGWLSSHYGRWGHSSRHGWYWIPGRRWSPAWVAWSNRGDRVGWSPLDRHGRPASYRGHAVRRGTARGDADGSERQAWSYSDRTSFGSRRSFRGDTMHNRSTDSTRRYPRIAPSREHSYTPPSRRSDWNQSSRRSWSTTRRDSGSHAQRETNAAPSSFTWRSDTSRSTRSDSGSRSFGGSGAGQERPSRGSWRLRSDGASSTRRGLRGDSRRSLDRGDGGSSSSSSPQRERRSYSTGSRSSSSGGGRVHKRGR